MNEWWDKFGEMIARQLAHRWRNVCGGAKPPMPIQENEKSPHPAVRGVDPKDEKGQAAS